VIVERVKCDSCANPRYCLKRDGATQCLTCALGDVLLFLGGISADIRALKDVTSRRVRARRSKASPGRCIICKKNATALVLPYWGNMCAFCIAESFCLGLELIRAEIKTILQACANCGQPAVYLWAGQLPLCEPCAVSAGQGARTGGDPPPGFRLSVSPPQTERSQREGAPREEE